MKDQITVADADGEHVVSRVFSWDLEDLTAPQKHFHLAKAYLDSCIHVFEGIIGDALPATFSHAQSAAFLFGHGLELFLKGGIAQAGRHVPTHHNIQQIYREFSNLYPGKKFQFEGRIEEAVTQDPNRPHGEFTRYPIDKSGSVWMGHFDFVLELWLEQMQAFRKDFERLTPLIEERYGKSSEQPNSSD